MAQPPRFLVHDSQGLHLWSASQPANKLLKLFETDTKPINIFPSRDRRYLAIIFKKSIQIFSTTKWEQPIYELPIEDVKHVSFSPKSSFFLIYTLPNANVTSSKLKLFDVSNGNLVYEWSDNKLIQWSNDEKIALRMAGSMLLFYENNDFTKYVHKFSQKISAYSFATNKAGCTFVSMFIKGQKDTPSIIRIHGYPHLENAIVSKSLYKVDSIDIKWNPRGDTILILASTDYDTSGASYYGKTMLYFMDLDGTSITMTGSKEGTVSAAEWLSNNEGFIVIEGKIPATITWYNNKAELIHSFGNALVNEIHVNPFSNLVAFTGFGNLSGDIFIWNLRTKTMISNFRAVATTYFSWLADGQHMITATHYDRLKVANGFKLWDYLGNMLHQEDCLDDSDLRLFKIFPIDLNNSFQEPEIDANVKGKILCDETVKKYVPPSLRNKIVSKTKSKPSPPIQHLLFKDPKDPKVSKDKKLKNLNKKLKQIEQLKKLQEEGKQLEQNQINKIKKEDEIIKAIQLLELEA